VSGMPSTSTSFPTETRLRWLEELIATPGRAAGIEPVDHFVPSLLDRYPDGLAGLLAQLRVGTPHTALSSTSSLHKGWLTVRDRTGARKTLSIIVDTSGRIRNAWLRPEVSPGPEATPHDWAGFDTALRVPGLTCSALVAEVRGQQLVPLYERDPETPRPSGSLYKLYLMYAVLGEMAEGRLAPDDELVVSARTRSLPSGEMQDLPDGTAVRVRDAAFAMFALSDNTAADMLHLAVGRAAVERAVVGSGHRSPDLLRPFPTSRELFEVGWGDPGSPRTWATGDEAARRRLLAAADHPLTVRIADLREPVHQHGLDWFMSAGDVARAAVALTDRAQGETARFLNAYPGVRLSRPGWAVKLFKGGSCPGVVAFCWLVESTRGERYVIVLQWAGSDPAVTGEGLLLRHLGAHAIEALLP
jgi:hypothetical protein